MEQITKSKGMLTNEILDIYCPSYQRLMFNGNEITARVMAITPSLAERLLEKNINNRPFSKNNVTFLVKEMLKGNWKFGGEPIKFDSNGNLIDGQHRLKAIIDSGITCFFLVLCGLDSDVFSVLDTGRKRQGSDVLAIHGVKNSSLVSSTIKSLSLYNNGCFGESGSTSRTLSNEDILEFFNENKDIERCCEIGVSLYSKSNKILTPTVISLFYFLLSKISEKDGDDFLTKVCTGIGLEDGSPINALRNKLIRAKVEKNFTLIQSDIYKYIIITWNKYRLGERAKNIKLYEDNNKEYLLSN